MHITKHLIVKRLILQLNEPQFFTVKLTGTLPTSYYNFKAMKYLGEHARATCFSPQNI